MHRVVCIPSLRETTGAEHNPLLKGAAWGLHVASLKGVSGDTIPFQRQLQGVACNPYKRMLQGLHKEPLLKVS